MKCSFCKLVDRLGVWVRHHALVEFVCMGCLHRYFAEEPTNGK